MDQIAQDKQSQINNMTRLVRKYGFTIAEENLTKPWGAYLRFADTDINQFVSQFFMAKKNELLKSGESLSPKFLLIAPKSRLSWQYHHHRGEFWTLLSGDGGVVRSETDEQHDPEYFDTGKIYGAKQGIRHRLLSGESWSLIAEVWIHLDPSHPSTEEDNVRLDDDYHRQGTTNRH